MLAHFEERHGGGVVVIGGNGDAERLAFPGEFAPVFENLEAEFGADLLRGLLLNVENADHFGVGTLSVQPGVMAAESADADDADLELAVILHGERFPLE